MTFRELYLSRVQVADEYPISVRKLCELHKIGELRAVTINGKSFYARQIVDQYFLKLAKHAEAVSVGDPMVAKKRSGRPTKAMEVAARKRTMSAQHAA